MKTYIRLLVLVLVLCVTLFFFLSTKASSTDDSNSSIPGGFDFTKRLYDLRHKFNHTVDTVDWPASAAQKKAKTLADVWDSEHVRQAKEDMQDWRSHGAQLSTQDGTGTTEVLDLNVNGLPDKVVIMGRLHTEDTSWVARELPDWQHAIYTVDAANMTTPLPPDMLTTPLNKGREVMPYLTYIIDHYTSLPSVLAFIHPHRDGYPTAWHTDAPLHSNVYSLQHLQLDYIKTAGYANLRCNLDPGCPAEVRPFAPQSTKEPEAHMAVAWGELFPEKKAEVPQVIAAACCAQFAVSREQVRERPLSDYVHFREWVTDTDLSDYVSGRVFEYAWHIIFGRGNVDCPSQRECYCNVYGRRCRGAMSTLNNGGRKPPVAGAGDFGFDFEAVPGGVKYSPQRGRGSEAELESPTPVTVLGEMVTG